MHVLYVASLVTIRKYQELFANSRVKPSPAAQKYHRLLAEGLVAGGRCAVTVIAGPPVSRAVTRRLFFSRGQEISNGVEYIYLPFINLPVLRQMSLFFAALWIILRQVGRDKESAVVCDVLNLATAQGALLGAWFARVQALGIVTDVPHLLVENRGERWHILKAILVKAIRKLNTASIAHFGAFLFLTEQMHALLNPKNRPYLVIEGQVDIAMQDNENTLEGKYPSKVCLYAGSLMHAYGIPALVQAFLQAGISGAELHIYGAGDYADELKSICALRPQIRFAGVVDNAQVVAEQVKAILLVNPRPSHESFTSYSFPSKNMEYMASGTPLLTTRLPGMPAAYYPFVYLIEEETVDGLARALAETLAKPGEELHEQGWRAKAFVLAEKNNVTQAGRVLSLLCEKTDA